MNKVAIIATDYFEETELTSPRQALLDAGFSVEIIAPHKGEIKGLKHIEPGQSIAVNKVLGEANPADYAAVVVPGGAVNADHLRIEPSAQEFVHAMLDDNKPTAVICHGPWLLVSAGLVKGRTLTSYHTIRDDITNAGGTWVDQPVVQDGALITSRQPGDLPAFNKTLLAALQKK